MVVVVVVAAAARKLAVEEAWRIAFIWLLLLLFAMGAVVVVAGCDGVLVKSLD